VTAKIGMGDSSLANAVDPWTATLVRVAFATPVASCMVLGYIWIKRTQLDLVRKVPMAWKPIFLGAVCGPFLGVGTALMAINFLDAGIAATLMATSPVMILPFARLVEGEHFDSRALWGAAIAVVGVGILVVQIP
jgi:drug/metabolite transporter (DMT)-like permease